MGKAFYRGASRIFGERGIMIRRGEAAGFSLIEVIIALVLIGTLAAVAVPRYFDLQAKAEDQVMASVAAEFNAQFESGFARGLLEGKDCTGASLDAVNEALVAMNGAVQRRSVSDGEPYRIYPNFLTEDGVMAASDAGTTITVHLRPSEKDHPTKEFDFRLPDCAK